MIKDNLQRFIELQKALVEERTSIQSRLVEIERVLGSMAQNLSVPRSTTSLIVEDAPSGSRSLPGKRKMSAEGRKRIAEAQRLRRLKERGDKKETTSKTEPNKGKRRMSDAAKKAIAAAAKKRWAAAKATGKGRL